MRDVLPQRYVVAIVFVAGMFMSLLDTTIVIVALPTLADDFGVGTSSIQWVVLGYLLGLATFIPASGWIGDRVGTKRTFLFALAMFTVASVLCGLAQSLPQLIAFRVLQGVGGGMLTPVGTAMLFRAFPPADRAKASRVLLVPTVIAPALGPVIGGYLVDEVSWRWIFFVNVPIGIAAFVFGGLFLHEHREPRQGGFDFAGFVLAGGGLASLLFALGQGPTRGWTSVPVVACGVAAIVSLTLLAIVELRTPYPMLKLRLLSNRMFRSANVAALFGYGAFVGFLFITPLYLQDARGLTAFDSGLTTAPEALGVLVASQIAGRVYGTIGPRRMMIGGLATVSLFVASFTQIDLTTNLWVIRGVMFIVGAAMAFVFVPMQAATFATISPADTGHASAIYSTQRQVAAALGVATLATALSIILPDGVVDSSEEVHAFHGVYLVAAAMALIGAAASFAIRDIDAASTMRARPNPAVALDELPVH